MGWRHLDQLLDVSRIRDYCPNGLQVEGRPEIARLASG
ncbi:MAG: Nif3-like dinuclear metal center protein, partial [Burkholderiales bacterium]